LATPFTVYLYSFFSYSDKYELRLSEMERQFLEKKSWRM